MAYVKFENGFALYDHDTEVLVGVPPSPLIEDIFNNAVWDAFASQTAILADLVHPLRGDEYLTSNPNIDLLLSNQRILREQQKYMDLSELCLTVGKHVMNGISPSDFN